MQLFLMALSAGTLAASVAVGLAARSRLARAPASPAWVGAAAPSTWAAIRKATLRPQAAVVGLVIWLMLVEAALSLAAPWPLALVVDYALSHRPMPAWLGGLGHLKAVPLSFVAAGAGMLLLASAALVGYLVTFLAGALSERIASRLRIMTISHVLRIPPRRAAEYPVGELANRISADTGRVADSLVGGVEVLIPDAAVLIGMIIITSIIDWRLTLVTLAIIPLFAVTSMRRNRAIRPAQRLARARSGELAALTTDVLGRIPAVHVFDRAETEVDRYDRASSEVAGSALSALDAGARFAPVTDTLPGLGLAAALVTGTIEVTSGRLSIGSLLVFLAYLASLTGPVRSLAGLSGSIARGAVSRERIAELLSIPVLRSVPGVTTAAASAVPEGPRRGSRSGAGTRRAAGCSVLVENVTYAHRPGRPVLASASLYVRAGEFVSLTGPSGAGKSTLLSLLVRLAEPDAGRIVIDGHDIAQLPLGVLRQLVALVPQEPWLHCGSIADNIAYGLPGATRRQVLAAAASAGVDSFARNRPAGDDTLVGHGGGQLSGGEQRRIAVARALIRDTPVLLLDEPTSGLDAATESRLVIDLLAASRGKTLILVTHRSALADRADRALHLDRGQISVQSAVDRTAPDHVALAR